MDDSFPSCLFCFLFSSKIVKNEPFSDAERVQIIMERERDGKRLETVARQHKCTPETISKILSHYDRTGEISGQGCQIKNLKIRTLFFKIRK